MPNITVFPDVPRAYNRVEVNWADTPSVTHARVLRVDVETGTCTPLRPYICFDGDALLLSCGHGIFWDTEVPLDRSVYYITEGADNPCIPVTPTVFDSYSRVLVDSWGVADSGQAYTLSGGTNPGNYDVNSGRGLQTMDSVNVRRHSFITTTGVTDQNVYVTSFLPIATTTGGSITQWLLGRLTDVNNWYSARIELNNTQMISLVLCKRVASLVTDLTVPLNVGIQHLIDEPWRIRLNVTGSVISGKAWRTSQNEPSMWQAQVVDTDLPSGTGVGVATRLEVGNLNSPIVSSFDDLYLGDPCDPCVPVTAASEPSTMPSNGAFRLKDPVRPCNDIYMPLCFDQSTLADHRQTGQYCAPGTGVFFASMETETYEPNTLTVNPTNARRPIAITRQRRDVASNLTVVARTFTDRDNLLRLTSPGSPILLQGPPQYGIPDRYMDVGTVGVDRGLTDHRFQVRVMQMPHVAVDRPAGPSSGVCGSRVADLCDFTFDELAAEGNTWEDLVRGRPTGATTGFRTWNDVLGEFADWDDVNDGVRTWYDLETGD